MNLFYCSPLRLSDVEKLEEVLLTVVQSLCVQLHSREVLFVNYSGSHEHKRFKVCVCDFVCMQPVCFGSRVSLLWSVWREVPGGKGLQERKEASDGLEW